MASVRPSQPGAESDWVTTPGRLTATNVRLVDYIQTAFGGEVPHLDAPEWIVQARFDIQAVHSPTATVAEVNAMLHSLLAERFGLKSHWEDREMTVYALVRVHPDALGPNLRQVEHDCTKGQTARCFGPYEPSAVIATGLSWARIELASRLRQLSLRYTIDETGLTGNFDIALRWQPRLMSGEPDPQFADRPEIFTALREQLGLRLESKRLPLPVLVIDAVTRPAPN